VRAAGLVVLAMVLGSGACGGDDDATATTAAPPSASSAPTVATTPAVLNVAERSEIFEAVWRTVNDEYFDPTFGGRNWQAIGDRYRQQLITVEDDDTFWRTVNAMLFELEVSHLLAFPGELADQVEPTVSATGTLGIDVRLLDGQMVVTAVTEGSSAKRAGLRAGFVITAIDGRKVEAIAADTLSVPPDNERHRQARRVQAVRDRLYGDAGGEVTVEYLDEDDRAERVVVSFAPRRADDCGQSDPSLPRLCADLEVRTLADGVGYLRFSGFLAPVLDRVVQAIDDMHDAPAIIIDVRGNPGGVFEVRTAIASQLVGESALFMRYRRRNDVDEAYLDPVNDPYTGNVVVLVDELSTSSTEEFAGSLQSLGRATIVGLRTPGSCLVANLVPLPYQAVLMYPFGQPMTPEGRVLEDNGVIPDHSVALDRQQLLHGVDAQLEAAVQQAR
jgi:carboxyl-terminal processing protease